MICSGYIIKRVVVAMMLFSSMLYLSINNTYVKISISFLKLISASLVHDE